jgi:YD repeat-containing protein
MTKKGWKLYQAEISNSSTITISGNGLIDEVRLYPAKAQMSTFTYEPLIGMTSKCDANNRIEYYEYDSFGRLKLIRDFDGNIIKSFNYQYQTPQ